MDNLTHTLAGAALARAGLGRVSPRATATLIIASNLPDADSISGFWGQLYYLEHHRGITHSLVGIVLQALFLGGVLSIARRDDGERPVRPLVLMGLSTAALTLHLFMDYTNSYGLRLFLPWDGTWIYGDWVFIIDPWIWLLLGGALFATGCSHGTWNAGWLLVATATSALVVIASGSPALDLPAATLPVWCAGLIGAVALRRWSRWDAEVVSRAALVGLVLYWGLLASLHRQALRTLTEERQAQTEVDDVMRLAALPTPVSPFRWLRIVDGREELALSYGGEQGWIRLPKNLHDPVVQAARESCRGASLFRFFRFPVAAVERSEQGYLVSLQDVRFLRDVDPEGDRPRVGFGAAILRLRPDLSLAFPQLPCPPSAAWLTK